MKKLSLSFLITILTVSLNAQPNRQSQSNLIYKTKLMNLSMGFAVGEDGLILKTIDSGKTWIQQLSGTTQDLMSLCFSNEIVTIVGEGGTIFRSTDGGDSWIQQNSGVSNPLTDVYFSEANKGVVVGFGISLRTTDGGMSWTSVFLADWYGAVYFTDINTGTAVGMNGRILKTTDGGIKWNLQESGTTKHLSGVSFIDSNNGIVVGDSGIILKTTNGGSDWISQMSGTLKVITDVCCIDINNCVAVGNDGIILKSTDGGINWAPQSSGTSNSLMSANFIDYNNGLAGGAQNTILKTIDGGITWNPQTVITSIHENQTEFTEFFLSQNYPNPFNPTTKIKYTVPKQSIVQLNIFDGLGREIETLLNEVQSPGHYTIDFDASNLTSGIYYCQLKANGFIQTKKMILLK